LLEIPAAAIYTFIMEFELTPTQKAWIQAEIAARRFKDEAHARAYLSGMLDDAMQYTHAGDYTIDELRRLVRAGIESGPSVDENGNPMDGAATMARILERARAFRRV
jgi:hypothetical protein